MAHDTKEMLLSLLPLTITLSCLNQRFPQMFLKTGCFNSDILAADGSGWLVVALSCKWSVLQAWERRTRSQEEGWPSAATSFWYPSRSVAYTSATSSLTSTHRGPRSLAALSVGKARLCSHKAPISVGLLIHSLSGSFRGWGQISFKRTNTGDQMFSTNGKHVHRMRLEHLLVPESKDMLRKII